MIFSFKAVFINRANEYSDKAKHTTVETICLDLVIYLMILEYTAIGLSTSSNRLKANILELEGVAEKHFGNLE